jgi:hypothetical protein
VAFDYRARLTRLEPYADVAASLSAGHLAQVG